jgi:putative tricarboxylic transport membrane protein
MESLQLLAGGIVQALEPAVLLATLVGVLIGLLIGALPGLGPAAGVAIMLPVAVGFDGVSAIAALAGIYYGAMFGGAVTSILLGIPGDAPSVMTVIDGHALAKKGQAGRALGLSTSASFIGGFIGVILLALLSVPIASVALKFGPTETTALMCFSLSLVSVLGGRNLWKGFASLFLGMWIGMVGLDPVGGPIRFTFGSTNLFDGIDFTIVAVGLFGLSEMFTSFSDPDPGKAVKASFRSLLPRLSDVVETKWAILQGSFLGFAVGVLPGIGATASTMLSYAVAKKTSRDPDSFGKGSLSGVAAPEAANNSSSYASMIPLFTLGIPASATTAVLLGGFLMIGLQPGPLLFATQPEFVWTVFGTFWVGNLMLLFLTILLIPFLASVVYVRPALLYPAVIGIVVFGVYSINYSLFDVGVALTAGLVGYVMHKLDYAPVPMVLGLVLGPLLERGVRRTLIISQGDVMVFLEHPISLVIFIVTAAVILIPLGLSFMRLRRSAAASNAL